MANIPPLALCLTYCYLLLVGASHNFEAEKRAAAAAAMSDKITTFVHELGLPSSTQASELGDKLRGDSNLSAFLSGGNFSHHLLAKLACSSIQKVLGPNSAVDYDNQTEVDANCFFQTKFSVRSGGHSPNPGWSSIRKPGILIDLQKLNKIAISTDKSVISLGPGGRWGDFYTALDPYGVSVIGGRLPDVGIVLADGTIVDANAQQNSDLFWALKGGGPNFVHEIWYQVGAYTVDQIPAVLDAFVKWQENGASDVKSTVIPIIGLEGVTLVLIYSEPATQPAAFAPFYSIPAAVIPVPAQNSTVLGLTTVLASAFSNAPARQPGECRKLWTTVVDWTNVQDDATVRGVSIATGQKWQQLGEERGLYVPFLFMNDASRDQDPLSLYGLDNLSKLKAISKKYDPAQVFKKLQNDGFLLSKA
ncbi:hypothetical protein T310_5043 [Rasamsonia emersonii CBS 393.64]|uniref:FAD linked oxidase N-terminal domain-containing protein n=1 Tax=Rasamsonia emersonii (strain ATCC 16479 / CBS 393.64 / IMI 116815) TaxID=1408163 RepID=A0A0F4YTF2_RASE3|nr:hypothetical protein T310_5043 [Rasamsonia emersonii CBS 393.64]KKA20903.1 hypothetical protein T310_5043 [Rasamsonia emersonii CBS 393.64]